MEIRLVRSRSRGSVAHSFSIFARSLQRSTIRTILELHPGGERVMMGLFLGRLANVRALEGGGTHLLQRERHSTGSWSRRDFHQGGDS